MYLGRCFKAITKGDLRILFTIFGQPDPLRGGRGGVQQGGENKRGEKTRQHDGRKIRTKSPDVARDHQAFEKESLIKTAEADAHYAKLPFNDWPL